MQARSNILASQSADNYDEDFEVDDEEVASAVRCVPQAETVCVCMCVVVLLRLPCEHSADPENLDMSDFSAGNQSDREDSDF